MRRWEFCKRLINKEDTRTEYVRVGGRNIKNNKRDPSFLREMRVFMHNY